MITNFQRVIVQNFEGVKQFGRFHLCGSHFLYYILELSHFLKGKQVVANKVYEFLNKLYFKMQNIALNPSFQVIFLPSSYVRP